MRLVINSRNCNGAAGLERYKGEGIYSSLGKKNTGLRKVMNTTERDEADADNLSKKIEGQGIDAVDTSNIKECTKTESDEESCPETISTSSEEEPIIDDKESNVYSEDESVSNDKESIADYDEELPEKVDAVTPAAGVKRKFPLSLVDSIINESSEKLSQPKIKCGDTSFLGLCEKDDSSTSSNVDECDIQPNEQPKDKKEDHSLIKIPPTKRKKYSQKACVYCRQKYGIRNDTRYICTLCNIALCQEPCFSDYHFDR